MRMTRELVLCALHRAGEPVDTGTLLELVRDLAIDGGWPARAVAAWSAKALPPMLRHMQADTLVHRTPDQQRYYPATDVYDTARPIPAPPDDTAAEHDLDGMSRTQLVTVFEVQSDVIARLTALCADQLQASARFAQQFQQIQQSARTRLYAVGLGDRIEG